ncbi:protein Malvolio-like isoform X2 [Euwallacea fornicatus]|uniref:protein Malvolio-like isoform X1 n=2 Tax=Euwallacea fornicatus TaxID=995702 RepID=UPI003390777E
MDEKEEPDQEENLRGEEFGGLQQVDSTDESSSDNENPEDNYNLFPPRLRISSDQEIIHIPEVEGTGFSFRKLWAYCGPGFLMSIAFLDPGNIESDLQCGNIVAYRLLWILLGSTVLGLLMQRLSARLGVVTGLHMAELCYYQYQKIPRILLWLMMEIAIIGSDMQEVIGTAIALYMLSNRKFPIWGGVLVTILDTFTFLFIDNYGLRKLEAFFIFLISIMTVTFGFEYGTSKPDSLEVLKGLFVPWCEGCDNRAILQAIGIIGAIIMPHNFYLHSALVKSREVDRSRSEKVREANLYYFIECCFAIFVSLIINIFVLSVFAHGLYGKTNKEVHDSCPNSTAIDTSVFPSSGIHATELVDADLYNGGIFLGCAYGLAAMYIWAIGLLAAGQSSTMTGTYAGQFIMEGFLNLRWPKWKRVLVTRSLAIIPTFCVAFFTTIDMLTNLNDILNALMSIQLPFATIPLIAFTSSSKIMGEFVNGIGNKIMSITVSLSIIAINTYFVVQTILDYNLHWVLLAFIGVVSVFYFGFCSYLILHMMIYMGNTYLLKFSFVRGYVIGHMERYYIFGEN